jgi:subtilisin family serine protease
MDRQRTTQGEYIMRKPIGTAVVAAIASLIAGAAALAAPKSDATRYLVSHAAGKQTAVVAVIESAGGRVLHRYRHVPGVLAELSPDALRQLRSSGTATAIERDVALKLHAHLPDFTIEFLPFGVTQVRANEVWASGPDFDQPAVRANPLATGDGVVVAVLDTGIDFAHPDLIDNIAPGICGSGVIRDFIGTNPPEIEPDDCPADDLPAEIQGHGTSSASVIASVDNEVGVIGVAPRVTIMPYRVCFADFTNGCPLSAIIGGLEQAIDDGADVINMSFGGRAGFNIEAAAIQAANRAGIVMVASAGNDASQQSNFPAAYATVIATGAVDANNRLASFSNVGGWVDVTAPGVNVPAATFRGAGRDAFLEENTPPGDEFVPLPFAGSGVASATADVTFAGLATTEAAEAACGGGACDGRIVLIQRGEISFAEKVQNVLDESPSTAGVVIFNNVAGNFSGTLGALVVEIPVVSLSDTDGATLRDRVAAGTVNLTVEVVATDYDLVSGTSFSAPHVSGVAALVRDANPALTPLQVRKIITRTARPIGAQVIFGAGLVDAAAAVDAAR